MLIDKLKESNMEALKTKDKNARAILSVVVNKYMLLLVSKREKNEQVTDADVVALLQKTIKELNEEKENFEKVKNEEKVASINEQRTILEKFLPTLLKEEEINDIILKLADKSIPSVMKHFKINYAGKCDMQVVNKIAKNYQG